MKTSTFAPALAAAFLILLGCGGGGGDNGTAVSTPIEPTEPVLPSDPAQPSEPVEPAEPTVSRSDQIQAELNELIDNSTTVLDADTIAMNSPGTLWHPPSDQDTPAGLDLDDLADGGLSELEYGDAGSRAGISLVRITRPGDSDTFKYRAWAGWAEHSFYVVRVSEIIDNDPLHPSKSVFSHVYSVGDATGTNPVSGSATWDGAMVGTDVSDAETKGNTIVGDATIRINDFNVPAVHVGFVNVVDQDTGTARLDITWDDVPLMDGRFRDIGLLGQFYGPSHEEAGGIFIRNQSNSRQHDIISGAFGAKRVMDDL